MQKIYPYCILVRDNDLIHMVARLYSFVLLPELNGPFRIAFQVDKERHPFQANQCIYIVHGIQIILQVTIMCVLSASTLILTEKEQQ